MRSAVRSSGPACINNLDGGHLVAFFKRQAVPSPDDLADRTRRVINAFATDDQYHDTVIVPFCTDLYAALGAGVFRNIDEVGKIPTVFKNADPAQALLCAAPVVKSLQDSVKPLRFGNFFIDTIVQAAVSQALKAIPVAVSGPTTHGDFTNLIIAFGALIDFEAEPNKTFDAAQLVYLNAIGGAKLKFHGLLEFKSGLTNALNVLERVHPEKAATSEQRASMAKSVQQLKTDWNAALAQVS